LAIAEAAKGDEKIFVIENDVQKYAYNKADKLGALNLKSITGISNSCTFTDKNQ